METQIAEEVRAIYITRSGRDTLEAFAQDSRWQGKQVGRLLEYLVTLWDQADETDTD
jgi:hypothetical protein